MSCHYVLSKNKTYLDDYSIKKKFKYDFSVSGKMLEKYPSIDFENILNKLDSYSSKKETEKLEETLKDKIENLLFGNQNEKITFYSKRTTLEKEFEVASENLSAVKKIFNRSAENFDAKKLDTALGLVEKKTKLQNGKFVEQIVKGRGVFQNADSFSKKVVGGITEVGAKATIKSTAKGFANALGINESITSPTFNIIKCIFDESSTVIRNTSESFAPCFLSHLLAQTFIIQTF